ncbi:hypothetical protein ACFCP7_24645 [Paenibacillus elgii]
MLVYCSPRTEDVEKHIESTLMSSLSSTKFLHIVPTMILSRRRNKFYRKRQLSERVDIYEMDEFLKKVVYKNFPNTLSKSESSVILERIMKTNPDTNNISWRSTYRDIHAFFQDLTLAGLLPTDILKLENTAKWTLLIELFESYLEALNNNQKQDFGQAAHQSLRNLDISNYEFLVLDGAFIPLTAKHQLLINKFVDASKPVILYLPYDLEQAEQPAQKVIETVYQNYVPLSNWVSIQDEKKTSFFINQLPKKIFNESADPIHLDGSMQLLRFSTAENELTYIVQQINSLIRFKGVSHRQIAIVTPNAMELRPFVREISEQFELKVQLPKKPLLQLTQGRALKFFFDVFNDVRRRSSTYLNVTMFKTFLHESVLKKSTDLLNDFERIECFFVDCDSIDDWRKIVSELIIAKSSLNTASYIRHPLMHISIERLHQINEVLGDIEYISKKIMDAPESSVKNHVNRLVSYLETEDRLCDFEDEVSDRIKKIGEALQTQERLTLTTAEFGERISGLFTEHDDAPDEEYTFTEDIEDIENGILVTGPNNVEYQRYQYIFLCRFTQDIYPEPKRFTWLQPKHIERKILELTTQQKFDTDRNLELFYADRAMYHVYLTFNASEIQLTVSYSQLDNGVELSPAHYLHDIARVIGIEEGDRLKDKTSPTLEKLLEMHYVLKNPEKINPVTEVNDEPENLLHRITSETIYSVEDVAIFNYCQRRFYYQKKYPEEASYSNLFHLQAYASSCLYEKVVELFVSTNSSPIHESDQRQKERELLKQIIRLRHESEPSVRPIFPVSTRIWHNIVLQTDFFLRGLIDSIFNNPYLKELRKKGASQTLIELSLSSEPREIKVNGLIFTAKKELEIRYNRGRVHRYSISNRKDFLYFTSKDRDEQETMEEQKIQYFNLLRQFYSDDTAAANQLVTFSEQIKDGKFEKSTGGHCKFCAFNKHCQEREVEQ